MFAENVSYGAAFLAGLLSFLSPCVLPLIPAYFTFITGISLDELTTGTNPGIRKKVILSTLAFVLGFSLVFVILGASASKIGLMALKYKDNLSIAGGILIIILGMHMTGFFRIKFLELEKRFQVREKPIHIFGAFFVGMAFGGGWSPCIGPLLGSILIVAGNQDTVWKGMVLLSIYSAGLALPFILISVFINYMLVFLKKASKIIRYVNIVAGALLVAVGLALATNNMSLLTLGVF